MREDEHRLASSWTYVMLVTALVVIVAVSIGLFGQVLFVRP